jgi:hypothetical protein
LKSSAVLFLILFIAFNTAADTSNEIDHLLGFVASTDCKYERNGELHSGTEAVKQLQKKYGYFRDDIEKTEDFVKYSAT